MRNYIFFSISFIFLIFSYSCDNLHDKDASIKTISNEETIIEDINTQDELPPADESIDEEQQEDVPSEDTEDDIPDNATSGLPESYTDKLLYTPDLLQINDYLPGEGRTYCGPVAVSNALIALAHSGYDNFIPYAVSETESQLELARILGEYMNTGLTTGTDANDLLKGVKEFITSRDYTYSSILYQGVHSVDSEFNTGIEQPELTFIKQGVLGFTIVVLQIGWYDYSSLLNYYFRISGHYVTVAGYGEEQNGTPDADILIIHDPSPRSGPEKLSEYVKAVQINNGSLGLFESARGLFYLDGIMIPGGSDYGIIEGVIVVTM